MEDHAVRIEHVGTVVGLRMAEQPSLSFGASSRQNELPKATLISAGSKPAPKEIASPARPSRAPRTGSTWSGPFGRLQAQQAVHAEAQLVELPVRHPVGLIGSDGLFGAQAIEPDPIGRMTFSVKRCRIPVPCATFGDLVRDRAGPAVRRDAVRVIGHFCLRWTWFPLRGQRSSNPSSRCTSRVRRSSRVVACLRHEQILRRRAPTTSPDRYGEAAATGDATGERGDTGGMTRQAWISAASARYH